MLAVALWMALHGGWPVWRPPPGCWRSSLSAARSCRRPWRCARPSSGPCASPGRFPSCSTQPAALPHRASSVNAAILKALAAKAISLRAALTDADYQELLELAYQQGALAQSEKEIILQIISLDRRTAREVMKPRSQMAAISDDLSVEEMIAAARKFKHRRLPIYDETPDTIVGILNTRALAAGPAN